VTTDTSKVVVIETEAAPLTREEALYFEVQRLRILLDNERARMKLADERASLQRMHIAQLQNQLGVGVCREKPVRKCQNPDCKQSLKTGKSYCSHQCAKRHYWRKHKEVT